MTQDPYWADVGKEPPQVVTDWALISSQTFHANVLRRLPSELNPPNQQPLIKSIGRIVPGADVVSSGRTSGYQSGQVCEIPAYVSGEANGTGVATREWFIEEPHLRDDEEAWIRGGIGVEGDSGAAVVDSETNTLIGHLWGRNRYWGPGPRHAFVTPIADVFNDIEEKREEQAQPQLPQNRDSSDCQLIYPTCRQCYDQCSYLDSRRSSLESLQIMGLDREDSDWTFIDSRLDLVTSGGYHWPPELEGVGSAFDSMVSPDSPSSFKAICRGLGKPRVMTPGARLDSPHSRRPADIHE